MLDCGESPLGVDAVRSARLKETQGFGQIFTWDTQVDGSTRHTLAGHLIHRLHVVTPGIRRRRCQDNQLIVQSDCSAGHKWERHTHTQHCILKRQQ